MSVRGLYRGKTAIGSATATNAPIYVDSDDNLLKINPEGTGTTERVVQTGGAASLTSASTLAVGAYGKTYFLNLAAGFATILPAAQLGAKLTFIVGTAPSGGSYTIVTPGSPDQILFGKILSAAGDAGDVENTGGGTTITFADGQAVVGDKVVLESDGTNWYVLGAASVAAGITITG